MLFSKSKANDRAAELEAMFSALDKAQAMIWYDPAGNILDANDNFLASVGYALDEIKGKHRRMLSEADDADFWKALGRGETATVELARRHKDGGTVYVEASYSPVVDTAGEVKKIVEIAVDVTERTLKSAEASEKP